MTKDLFIIDTRCHLNVAVKKVFERKGYQVEVGETLWFFQDFKTLFKSKKSRYRLPRDFVEFQTKY